MDQWPVALVGMVTALIAAATRLLARVVSNLRRNPIRYFWFEIGGGAFLIAVGLFWLLGFPIAAWPWRVPFLILVATGFFICIHAVSTRRSTSKAGRA